MISSALSPAKVEMVLINEEEKTALVVVPDFQLSLAIGKEGQNVRLAARLCGWKIDIKSRSKWDEMEAEAEKKAAEEAEAAEAAEETAEPAQTELPTPSAVKKMKKADLIAFAESLGIQLDPEAKNADMADMIIAHMEGLDA